MTRDEARLIQTRLGVTPDGAVGPVTYTALFRRLGASSKIAAELGTSSALNIPRFGIDKTPLRLAHFTAQVGHESGGFIYMEEIASGRAYEGRKDLGNIYPGDGMRYKGRGPIQITGRDNYERYGKILGLNLISAPQMASNPSIGMALACAFWSENGLNELADADNVDRITRRINGGQNGATDRKARLVKAKSLLL